MYTLELGVFMYRISIDDLPVAFKNCFNKRSDIHDGQQDTSMTLAHTIILLKFWIGYHGNLDLTNQTTFSGNLNMIQKKLHFSSIGLFI